MTTCPACGNVVDPLRSRFVGVRDGKVVAYCSAECAAGRTAEAAALAGRVSPATGVPVRVATPPSGVPARAQTPSGGVAAPAPAPAPSGGVRARAQVAVLDEALGPPRPATPAPGVAIQPDSGPVIEILHEPASGVVTSARDRRTEPRARHPDEIPIAAFWSADQDRAGAAAASEAGGRPAERRAGGATGATRAAAPDERGPERRDQAAADRAGRAASEAEGEPAVRRRRWPVVVLVVILLGAGGGALYYFFGRELVRSGHAADGRRGAAPAAAPAARAELSRPVRPSQVVAAAPVVDLATAVELARAALHRDLAATSPRVQRLAAAALARTRDPDACALLAAQIGLRAREPGPRSAAGEPGEPASSEIARLDLAYALARGGDPRGGDVLAGALGAARAEARDEAARLLALLGDRRAVPHLIDLLAVEQRRLGAAEHLAHLAEPHAIKILDQLRSDPRASADDKARATVALGVAGRAEVAGALRAMLGDPHFNAFAAAALAALDDRSALPVLERQLASPPLRVLAARALRRLDPAIDPRPLLPPLLDLVRAGRDIDRIPAAEAILLLAGPAGWSAYD